MLFSLLFEIHSLYFQHYIPGLAIVGVGVWTIADRYKYVELLSTVTYPVITYFLLGAGGLVLLVTLMGCCAIWFNNRPYLICYIFLLSFIFLTEIMVGVLAYIYQEQVQNELELNLNTTCLSNYRIDEQKTEAIDFLQEKFHCCGVLSFEDWKYSVWRKQNLSGDNLVPDSCCKTITPNCGAIIRPSNINYNSCLTKMADHMRGHLFILCVVGLGICCIQIFGIIFSCQLYFKLKDYLDYL
ncbi:hypothetical protein PPYR_07703 [Photinus pyralis]|uniref:Tetraspanin n=1 Tax=Photinus pyralis TaxID=7054 RepID=A0A5N4ARC4_PHOPY|nr:CD151 antigen-like isoform X2 [Photinus pyralis]KAB0799823.1 hypothetical protein PPYR_07703 [Photinus pyralis]